MDSMANNTSKPNSLLPCFLNNLNKLYPTTVKKVYDYSIIKSHLKTFCEIEWYTFKSDHSQGHFWFSDSLGSVECYPLEPSHPDKIGQVLPWAKAISNPDPMKVYMVLNTKTANKEKKRGIRRREREEESLKEPLVQASTLTFSYVSKPFYLSVRERKSIP